LSLFLRNLFFTVIHPGLIAGLIPWWIVRDKVKNNPIPAFHFTHYLSILIFTIGIIILVSCIASFAIVGKGTLSPADPTKKLVTSGLYRYSRNPMYVGVVMILTGESLFFQSVDLWWYLLIIFIAFNLFIILFEEPRLRKDFGEEYKKYRRTVRRWI
jgi:protein-S-isoprenylcysteine O-methyltransferase Ste14